MRIYFKLILFISAYTPLLLIIMLRYIQTESYRLALMIAAAIIISNITLLGYIYGIVKSRSNRQFKITKSVNKTSDTLNYILPYVVSFVSFQYTDLVGVLSLGILLVVVFVIYIQSNLILMNPMLNALGYKFYGLEINRGENIIVICKKDLKADITIKTKRITKGLYLLEDS